MAYCLCGGSAVVAASLRGGANMTVVTALDISASAITILGALAALINILRTRIFGASSYSPSKREPAKVGCGGMLVGAIAGCAIGVLLPVSFVTLPRNPPGLGLIVCVAGAVVGFFLGAYITTSVGGAIGGGVGAFLGFISTLFYTTFATLPGYSTNKSGTLVQTPPGMSTYSAVAVVSSAVIIGVFVGYLAGGLIERALEALD
jgi:hypothetical protein